MPCGPSTDHSTEEYIKSQFTGMIQMAENGNPLHYAARTLART